jgi:hypothetical protein
MKKAITLIFFIFVLPSCAILGSENYFAASTTEGKREWAGDPGISHITGQPDAIKYSKDEIEFIVYSSHLASKTYSFGPCIPLPLPIIPIFGLDYTEHNDPVQLSFYVFRTQKQYELTKATILSDNQALSPKEVKIYRHHNEDGKYITSEAFLPLSLNDKSTYVLAYDILRLSTGVYELNFIIQDESGSEFFKDKISFKKDKSTTLFCIP